MKGFVLLMPEIFLAVTLLGVVAGELTYHGERSRLIGATTLVGMGGALIQSLLMFNYGAAQIFGQSLSIDGLALFFKLFFIFLGALAVYAAYFSLEIPRHLRSEYCVLILGSTLAMCLAASSSDLLLIFLSLQFANVLGYFLSGYGKLSIRSAEAAVKQLMFGIVAAAMFLYGGALLFASTKTINLYEMHQVLAATPMERTSALIVFGLIFFSLAFQMAIFPMHLWSPDAVEGAPTPISGFVALGSRALGIVVTLRILLVVFSQPSAAQSGQWEILGLLDWTRILATISGLTMSMGALLAFRQDGAKRLVSYLLMAQGGFAMMGILVLDEAGLVALLYHLIVELFAVVGVFYSLAFLINQTRSDRLSDLRGMLRRAVPESTALILFLICLVGMPPLPGFVGKFALIGAAVKHHWILLAWVAALSIGLSMISVVRLAYSLLDELPGGKWAPIPVSSSQRSFLAVLLLPIFLIGIFSERVFTWASQSLRFIFW